MPKCRKCNEFLPPDLTEPIVGEHLCIFCKTGSNIIRYNGTEMSKEWAINDYKKFLYELSQNPDVKKLVNDGKAIEEAAITTDK